jgi:drug/metabolite transporter (DMT)-like permease
MSTASLIRLLSLSAIWGGSFLFMRIGAPALGPVLLIALRVGLAALFLLGVGRVLGKRLDLRRDWKHFLLLGLLLGVVGVGLLVGFDAQALAPGPRVAIALGLVGAFSYGIATRYARSARQVDPFANAHGSMWAATLLIAPAVPFFPAAAMPSATVGAAVLALGILCSGVAYPLYFRLIQDLGASSALTVTFLVPVFGVAWGHFVLGEPVGWSTLAGAGVVLAGTALVTGFSPAQVSGRRPQPMVPEAGVVGVPGVPGSRAP